MAPATGGHGVVNSKSLDDETDGGLVRRFALERDEWAFAKLVERRGPLVAGVCARMMRNHEDAEDAFQAVFLVLARRAMAVRRYASLAGWLHNVAVRVCLNERRGHRRRRRQLQEAGKLAHESARADRSDGLKQVIDEELAALPARLREVLILCDLEDHTQSEAARMLSLPVSTISGRLTRGRAAMRKRLMRHGLPLSAGGLAAALGTCGQAAPAITTELVRTTVGNAHIFLFGTAAAKAALGTHITSLADGVFHAMIMSRWKVAVCLALVLGVGLLGGTSASNFLPGLIGTASAATIFFDDFEDGSATDGSPVTWRPWTEGSAANGTFDASTGDFVLNPQSDVNSLGAVLDPAVNLANFSIRTQLRNSGIDDAATQGSGILIRANFANPAYTFFDCGIDTDGLLYIASHGPFMDLGNAQTDLRPLEEDVVLQVDVFGASLSLFAWRPGEPKPQQPQVRATSGSHMSGSIGIYYNPPPGNGTATFRYVHVADMSIPEPSGISLAAAAGWLLAGGLFFGRRRFWNRTSRSPGRS
jgi:RNA polymerase sigma factor (sigma-70 family)